MKRRILFVIESLHSGGAERSLTTLLNNIDYNEYNVDLLLFKTGGAFLDLVPKSVNILLETHPHLSLPERVQYKWLRFSQKHKHAAQLYWQIAGDKFKKREDQYDVAIAYNQGFATYYTERYINAAKKYCWLNTDYERAGYDIRIDYPIYERYNQVVTVSPEANDSLMRALARIHKTLPVITIKDITDEQLIRSLAEMPTTLPYKKDSCNILTVARLVKPKGLHLVVETCRYLLDKGYNVHWYILGEGAERVHLEHSISQLKLSDRVHLLGEQSNPYPYIKYADYYVQTSLFEGLGLSVIEALLLHKPVVSTNFPTVFGIIKDGETGLIAEMKSEDVGAKLITLMDNAVLRKAIIANLEKVENRDKGTSLSQVKALLSVEPSASIGGQ